MSDQNLSVLFRYVILGRPCIYVILISISENYCLWQMQIIHRFFRDKPPEIDRTFITCFINPARCLGFHFFPFSHPWLGKICNKSAHAFMQQTQCARYRFVWMCVWKLFKFLKKIWIVIYWKKEKILFCFIEKNVHLEPVVLYTCTYVL